MRSPPARCSRNWTRSKSDARSKLGGINRADPPSQSGKTVSLAGVLADATKPDPDHGCAGKNTCKGKGGCKSGDNGCGGKNSCKGKGGCAIKDGKPVHPVT